MFNRFSSLLLATTALVPLGLASAAANPLGAQVVGGSATVQGQGTATVTVTQQTNSAIVNWNTFNIGAGDKTKIVMPSSSSVQLDRVTGGLGPSQILGSLGSNGRVFLVNRDGILFGPGAVVDTAGFLATTHDIANADFMAGRYNFSIPGNPSASVVNQGTITAQSGGFAALVAPGVRNSGTITATLGTVALASGNGFTLDFYGDKLITLGVNDSIAATVKDVATGQALDTLVKNEGTLRANGGRVELTAAAARQVVDAVINTTGVIEANTIGTHNGMIVLGAATAASKPAGAPTQTVKVSGTLSAVGKNAGQTGGKIQITGEAIQVTGAKIDAFGAAGGGTVLIGGDWSGGNPTTKIANPSAALEPYAVPTATSVLFDPMSIVDVSANISGNGGKAIVWADQAASFYGTIFARGGPLGGNGGFVETSGHRQLTFNGIVDTGALNGKGGTLLLDPLNATIGGNISVASVQSALASGDVIVTTGTSGSEAGDITVAAPVSWANASALTLSAYRNIAVNADITNTGGAAVNLHADNTGTGVGTVNFGSGNFVSTSGPVSIFYNPLVNPAGSVVNATSYVSPTENFSGNATGGGTLTAYMLVNTVYDLQNIQNNLTGTYALGKDIDASATVNWNSGAGFVPIGGAFNQFKGTLNGNQFAVSNLSISASGGFGAAGTLFVGLFGYIGAAGKVDDINVNNMSIAAIAGPAAGYIGWIAGVNEGTISRAIANGNASISGNGGVVFGGIAGENDGLILGSSASGSMTDQYGGAAGGIAGANGGSIKQSYANVSLNYPDSGTNVYAEVGGLVGANSGPIDQSYSVGTVAGGNHIAGGFAGTNYGSISDSYATGAVSGLIVGGFVGDNEGVVVRSFATGNVSGIGYGYQGGLVALASAGTTINAYWDTQTTGQGTSAGGIGLTTAQFKEGLPSGFDPTVWGINATINNGYPYLKWQVASITPPPTLLTPSTTSTLTFTSIGQLNPIDYANDTLTLMTAFGVTDKTLAAAGLTKSDFAKDPLGTLNKLISYDQKNGIDPYKFSKNILADAGEACLAAVYTMIVQAVVNQTYGTAAPTVTIGQFLNSNTDPKSKSFGTAIQPISVYSGVATLTSASNIMSVLNTISIASKQPFGKLTFDSFAKLLTSSPVIVFGTEKAQQHYLLVTGTFTDKTGNYLVANDPLFGLQVRINFSTGQITSAYVNNTWVPFTDKSAIEQYTVNQNNIVNETYLLDNNYNVLAQLTITSYQAVTISK